MSPIADCGFQALSIVPGTNPPQVIDGKSLLVQKGPTVQVEIGFDSGLVHPDPAAVRAAAAAVAAAPVPAKLLDALIDTGALDSCIDEDLASALKLPLIDQGQCAGVGGTHSLNIYLGYIRIVELGFLQYGRFIGAKLQAGGQPHMALLGRNLLKDMILVYDGRDGTCRLAV